MAYEKLQSDSRTGRIVPTEHDTYAALIKTHGITNPVVAHVCNTELREVAFLQAQKAKLETLVSHLKDSNALSQTLPHTPQKLQRLSMLGTSNGRDPKIIPDLVETSAEDMAANHMSGMIYSTDSDVLGDIDPEALLGSMLTFQKELDEDIAEREKELKKELDEVVQKIKKAAKEFAETVGEETITELAGFVKKARRGRKAKENADKAMQEAIETFNEGQMIGTMRAKSRNNVTVFDHVEALYKLKNFDKDEQTGESKKVNIAESLTEEGIKLGLSKELISILEYWFNRKMQKDAAQVQAGKNILQNPMSAKREIVIDTQYAEGMVEVIRNMIATAGHLPDFIRRKQIVESSMLAEDWRGEKGEDEDLAFEFEGDEEAWIAAAEADLTEAEEELKKAEEALSKKLKSANRWKFQLGKVRGDLRATIALVLALGGGAWALGHFVTEPKGALTETDLAPLAASLDITLDGQTPDGQSVTDQSEEFRAEVAKQIDDAKSAGIAEGKAQAPEAADMSVEELNEVLNAVIDAAVENGAYPSREKALEGIEADLETKEGVESAIVTLMERTAGTASKYNPGALTDPRALKVWRAYRGLSGAGKAKADRALGL